MRLRMGVVQLGLRGMSDTDRGGDEPAGATHRYGTGCGRGSTPPEETGRLPLTVLLVEDGEDARLIYSTFLRHQGFRVIEATDGDEGIRLARANGPDLILMDLSLPGVDGWNATQALKQDPATAYVPVVALTAHARRGDRGRAQEVGFDGYLTKPIGPRAVAAEVERFIGRAQGPERSAGRAQGGRSLPSRM